MILISLFRLLMIFPFIAYILLILNKKSKKQSRIIVAPLYFISCAFITKYIFETPTVVLALIIFVVITILVALLRIKREYKIFNLTKVIREFLFTFSTIYPIIYGLLIVFGIGSIYMTMR